MKTATTTKTPRELARHTLNCRPCLVKADRLLATANHLEKQELLCAIEWHAYQRAGRKLHA